jgi:hypothetical protein
VSLINKISRFARSPQGKKLAGQAKTFAEKPENRRKIEQFRARLSKRRA